MTSSELSKWSTVLRMYLLASLSEVYESSIVMKWIKSLCRWKNPPAIPKLPSSEKVPSKVI